jgi:4-hydroxy-tetrahydrodipicolinate synthase
VRQNEFWSRVFTFVPTATKNDGEEIDEKRFLQAIDFQIDNGVDGICIFGSTGGNGSFSDEEMKTATTIAAKHINGRVPLVAGTGARTTTACIALSKHAEHVGCDGVMVLPVSYWPLTPDEVLPQAKVTRHATTDEAVRMSRFAEDVGADAQASR